MKEDFYLVNAAFAMATLDLISCVYLHSENKIIGNYSCSLSFLDAFLITDTTVDNIKAAIYST